MHKFEDIGNKVLKLAVDGAYSEDGICADERVMTLEVGATDEDGGSY